MCRAAWPAPIARTQDCALRRVAATVSIRRTAAHAPAGAQPAQEDDVPVDPQKLDALLGRFVGDLGATFHAGMVVIGDRLGLYKALGEAPATSSDLARRTETDARYVREWLSSQAAGGYVDYDPATERFSLSEEQAFALAQEGSPAFLPGAFQVATAALQSVPRIIDAFRTGDGYGWHQHDAGLFEGTERFFRPGYVANLVSRWLPALDGVTARLEAGTKVADIGCGHGASTLIMAAAYPRSTFTGFDYHEPSIRRAQETARQQGLGERVHFEVAAAHAFPGRDYGFVAVFDCLHDMGDPVTAARHVREALTPDGAWMIVEPFARDRLEDNLNPVGRVFYGVSTLVCTPASRAQDGGMCLGAQAGESRLRDVVTRAGFSRFRRAAETPFNLVFEARP
jgi:SAM-dependent methyltransferase